MYYSLSSRAIRSSPAKKSFVLTIANPPVPLASAYKTCWLVEALSGNRGMISRWMGGWLVKRLTLPKLEPPPPPRFPPVVVPVVPRPPVPVEVPVPPRPPPVVVPPVPPRVPPVVPPPLLPPLTPPPPLGAPPPRPPPPATPPPPPPGRWGKGGASRDRKSVV